MALTVAQIIKSSVLLKRLLVSHMASLVVVSLKLCLIESVIFRSAVALEDI